MQAAFAMFGCKPTDLIGKNVKMLMPPPFKEHHVSAAGLH